MKVDAGDGREDGDGAYDKPTGGNEPNEGAVYAVAGSSGKTSSASLNHPAMFVSMSRLGSMILDVYGDRLDAVFLDDAGATADHFTLFKGPDTTPPAVISATAEAEDQVDVLFAEPVDQASAETPSNYQIDGVIMVSAAGLSADGRTVTLTTSSLQSGNAYTLTVNAVADLAANIIPTDTETSFSYVAVASKSFQDGVAPTTAYAGTRDTYLREASATTNYGSSTDLQVDGDEPSGAGTDMVALLAWDLSEIPANAVIEGVTLTIQVFNASSGTF